MCREILPQRNTLHFFSALLLQAEFLRRRKHILRRTHQQRVPFRPINCRIHELQQIFSREEPLQNSQLLQEKLLCCLRIVLILRHTARASVKFHRLAHIPPNPYVVDYQPVIFPLVASIHPAYRLNQYVLAQRLIVVHVRQRRHIKSRYPHVHYNSYAEIRVVILEHSRKFLVARVILQAA